MSKRTKAILILVCVLGLIITGIGSAGLWENDGPGTATADSGIYFVQEINVLENRFVNQVDGYGISIPKDMKVVDMSFPGIRSVLEDEHRRVEIYKETTAQEVSGKNYIDYSNRFLGNQTDYRQVHSENWAWNGMTLNVVQWSREKLIKVDDDKNYYACVDIMAKDAVYTFFFKSDLPLEDCGGYEDIIKDFYTFAPTKQASAAQFKGISDRKWNQETRAVFEKYFSDDSRLQWGIFEPAAPFNMSDLRKLEQRLNYEFPFILLYSHVLKEYSNREGQALQDAYANGKIVELTLQTTATDGSNMVYDILNGQYDNYLRAYAQDVAKFGHPVLFRPFNEMNGDWCPYSAYYTSRDPEIFKELYKYVYNIFAEAGADNVIWVWNPNERSFPDFKWNNEILYYPGDKYVDVVGLTGYNTGTYYEGENWRSFREIYDPLYQKALALYDKPLMITEFASSSVGSSKEQWVKDMFEDIANYPQIKVAIWWDGRDLDSRGNIARPYFIDETDGLVAIFRENLQEYQ
ncbi:MAG: glycosyl hydrolase [Syntrophomonadaceae bacterium]|nr:glycosyl hydrolase [Syntrophomonadaceae bacterium]